ncbi:52 kda repressor of the inhibitor of the protein kinase [Plakobranchus ocellatus]|uniref:52 kDa repressor of the inhibitor of the protein kinase n=1 Tax=Plakobranchus ocellatus TaxID=259542 RepID=A0AAV4DZG8_9GAST|nr:52 kda repressor of the inhibitor of the protein kinase [Plakobranchus ocellatus]
MGARSYPTRTDKAILLLKCGATQLPPTKIGILRGQTSSTKYSPTWEKTSAKELKEQAENGRRCKKWVVNTRRADLLSTPVEALSKAYYLCAEHFEPSCFTEASPNRKRTRLTKSAVPTIFNIPTPPPQLSSSRPPPKQRAPIAVATSTSVTNKLKSSSTTCPSTSTVCNEDALNLSCKSMKRKLEQERVKTSRLRKRL